MSQGTNEIQGPFTKQFTGLNLLGNSGDIDPSASTVFHNCDVSTSGAVVRRGGTQVVANVDVVQPGSKLWYESIRTRNGSEYSILVGGDGFTVSLVRDRNRVPDIIASVAKFNVWGTTPSDVSFVPLTSPFDRLLVITPEHPIVQLSFLERSFRLVCTAFSGGLGSFSASLSPNDSTLWNDTSAVNYIVTDNDTGSVYPMGVKSPGFTFTVAGTFTVGQTYSLTLRQVTWQWWAEAIYLEGADITQTVSRINITDADQNVRVPARLITDLNPIYKNSQEMGLRLHSVSNWQSTAYSFNPQLNPTTENEFGYSSGARYVPGANNRLTTAPFFATFGARQSGGGVGQAVFLRYRELRFNGGQGVSASNLHVQVGEQLYAFDSTFTASNSYQLLAETFTATERVLTANTLTTQTGQYIGFYQAILGIPFDTPIHLTNVGSSTLYGSSARRVHYRSLTSTGGQLDGTFVRAYGIGKFVDYSKREFHPHGIVYRGRLILINPPASADQLLVSEVGDTTVPGEFSQFFQVTDMLEGVTTDPFTINVTSDSRERLTALVGWQQAVFAFTNSNTYGIEGGEQFSPNSFAVNLVSTYGAFNRNCVVVTNLTVLYMNRFGLFDLLNKPNTDSYGAVERSVKVRPLFDRDIASSEFDRVHWLRYNESSNKVYVGLGVGSDTITTSRNLVLNMTWEAWSTIASAMPFRMFPSFQLFGYTMLVAEVGGVRHYALLCADMPYYADFAYSPTVTSYPRTVTLPNPQQTYPADSRGIVQVPNSLTPGLNDYSAPGTTKEVDRLLRTDGLPTPTQVVYRNAMVDFPALLQLAGGNSLAGVVVTVQASGNPFTLYSRLTPSGSPVPNDQQLNAPNNFNTGLPMAPSGFGQLVGLLYPSIYSSPVFDLDMMGRLKRLKKLHLLFDTTAAEDAFYPDYPNVRVTNAALVSIVSNYREQVTFSEVKLVGVPEIRGVVQESVVLQGYGCDYQFYVTSVGAEAFRLTAYEFDIQPASAKRYIRR